MSKLRFSYEHTAGIDKKKMVALASPLSKYLKYLRDISFSEAYDGMETSINLPFDEKIVEETKALAHELSSPDLKYIIVCGIGGSNLGPLAVYEAMTSKYDLSSFSYPKMLFLDTVSLSLHKMIQELIDQNLTKPSEFVLSVVSKSGSTTETIANANTTYSFLSKKFGDISERVVVTTEVGSKLWTEAEEKKFKKIDHRNVGGRFSIMSPVGQVPLRLAGIDVDQLLAGAADMRNECLVDSIDNNPALASAVLQYAHWLDHININDNFFFDPRLESLGKWYRQLMAESIGKRTDVEGKEVRNGITPNVSIGSTDLHSMVQLYLGGPRDKFTNFVYANQGDMHIQTQENTAFANVIDAIDGKSLANIMDAIYEGVKVAYQKEDIPFMEVKLDDISEYSLGQYMQMKMIEMMLLGKLMHVNTFNQPSVEIYKQETRKILAGEK